MLLDATYWIPLRDFTKALEEGINGGKMCGPARVGYEGYACNLSVVSWSNMLPVAYIYIYMCCM